MSTERAMSLLLKEEHEKGGISDCFAGVFHTSHYVKKFQAAELQGHEMVFTQFLL